MATWIIVGCFALLSLLFVFFMKKYSNKAKEAKDKLEEKTGFNIELITNILKTQEVVLKKYLGDRYQKVYDAVLLSLTSIWDGQVTEEEAQKVASEVLEASLKAGNIELGEEEHEIVFSLLKMLVGIFIRDDKATKNAVQSFSYEQL